MAVWSTVPFSDVRRSLRFDAEHYRPEYRENLEFLLTACRHSVETIGALSLSITGGATPKGAEYVEEGIPFLRVQNVMPGYLALGDVVYVLPEVHAGELARSQVASGDVLLTITGMTYGKAAVAPEGLGPANINQHSVRMSLRRRVLPEYVATFLNSRYGKLQSDMLVTGISRPALNYGDIRRILIPVLPEEEQLEVQELYRNAEKARQQAKTRYAEAEALLADALGLDALTLPTPKTYTAPFSDCIRYGRIDAEFFEPRAHHLLSHLAKGGLTVLNVASFAKKRFRSKRHFGTFDYIEIGGLTGSGEAETASVSAEEAASRAQWVVRPGDVLTSSVRPIRRLSALVGPEQAGAVASSGFFVLRPRAVLPEVLLVYLRLQPIVELLDLFTTATMYPAISEESVARFPFPEISRSTQSEVADLVQASFSLRQRAAELLTEAVERVETFVAGA